MDEFWLPPWESSRILRENDCLKVVISKSENAKTIDDFSDDKLKKSESLELKKKPKETNLVAKSSSSNFFDNSASLKQKDSKLNDKINLFDNINSSKSTADKLNLSADGKQINKNSNQTKAKNTNKKNKNSENNLNESQVQSKKIHSKFAVANYVHLLDDSPQEEYCRNDETYNVQEAYDEQAYQYQSANADVDKIASSVNSTGKFKWKNSNKPVSTKAPTHIIFESTEESSSSSSSSDSSSSTSETSSTSELNNSKQKKGKQMKENAGNAAAKKESNVAEKTQKVEAKKETNKPKMNNEKANKLPVSQSENNLNKKQQNKKQLKTKEEQLNAVNYNRSFVIQNPNDINAFEKVFNETKHKSPMKPKKQSKDAKKESEVLAQQQIESPKEKEAEIEKAKYDFEKLDPLLGAPTVGQIIAFQVLELTKDFTPEISAYKTGNVKKFDALNDEITLKLDDDYNRVLKVPNKFTVVRRNSAESSESSDSYEEPDENEHEHVFNWKDLLNVKVIEANKSQTQME